MDKPADMAIAQTALAEEIGRAGRVVVFTGAGLSTECGIPDFRSPGGIWTKLQPIEFADFMASEDMRKEAWRRKFALDDEFGDARPGRGHKAIEAMVRRGKVAHVITQNIDNLHQASGVPEAQIIELHGNATYAKCLTCNMRHEIDWVRKEFGAEQQPPPCTSCGGIVKSATISFGQAMPADEMDRAEKATLDSDLFIVIGSSLVVYPAAGFPLLAKEHGARLAIINRDPTDMDALADLVIQHDIGTVMAPLITANR